MPPHLLSAAPPLFLSEFGPVLVPLVAGAAALYFLVPRPRAYPLFLGALLGILALVLAGVLLVPSGRVTLDNFPEVVLFYAFSGIAVVAATLLVTQRNPARAALSFTLVVLSTCGLFLLLAAPFLMAATIIVYAGAIIVTFLFVLMLAQPEEGLSDADARSREPLLATATGFLLLGTILYVLQLSYGTKQVDELLDRTRELLALDNQETITLRVDDEELFQDFKEYLRRRGLNDLRGQVESDVQVKWLFAAPTASVEQLHEMLRTLEGIGEQARNRLASLEPSGKSPLSNLSGPPSNLPGRDFRRDSEGRPQMPAENAQYLGRSLFTDYLLGVELGGVLLLVATVGAIAIAYRQGHIGGPA